MGSPLGPTLANIFLCYHETMWLKNCPKSFKPVYYKRYIDDIFVLFEKPEQVFHDVKICREKDKSTASVFRKGTFSGVYTNFSSFVALKHKFGLVHTFFYIEVSLLCLIFPNLILKLKHLRKHFTKMLIPLNLLTNV